VADDQAVEYDKDPGKHNDAEQRGERGRPSPASGCAAPGVA